VGLPTANLEVEVVLSILLCELRAGSRRGLTKPWQARHGQQSGNQTEQKKTLQDWFGRVHHSLLRFVGPARQLISSRAEHANNPSPFRKLNRIMVSSNSHSAVMPYSHFGVDAE
jgi:hypothetical protein